MACLLLQSVCMPKLTNKAQERKYHYRMAVYIGACTFAFLFLPLLSAAIYSTYITKWIEKIFVTHAFRSITQKYNIAKHNSLPNKLIYEIETPVQ